MGRLISKHELHKTMHDSSQLYCAEPPLHMGVCTSAMRGGSQQHNFEATKPSRSTLSDPLESQASIFHAAKIYMGSQQYEHQAGNTLCSQIPTYDSHILLSQFSGYNFSTDSAEKAGSNFDSRNTLQSLVTYHLCRNKCCSSSDKSIILPCSNTPKLFSPDQKVLFAENAASDRGQLPVPSDATQVYHSSSSKPAPRNKKRVRWTQDLHEQFVKCVNGLGGTEKATPKAILKLMDTDLLTILHVKSHLQKYRTTQHIPEGRGLSLQEKSERRTSANDSPGLCTKIKQMKEALQLQLEVERHLHEQLELQKNLQLLIEEENKQLKMMFDQQQKRYKSQSTLGPQN